MNCFQFLWLRHCPTLIIYAQVHYCCCKIVLVLQTSFRQILGGNQCSIPCTLKQSLCDVLACSFKFRPLFDTFFKWATPWLFRHQAGKKYCAHHLTTASHSMPWLFCPRISPSLLCQIRIVHNSWITQRSIYFHFKCLQRFRLHNALCCKIPEIH